MTQAIKLLQQVVVNHFYKVNSGFFLFFFFVLFGLPYSVVSFHLSIITGIIQSQAFLGVVLLVWILYNLKCIDYVVKHLSQPQQSFLFCLNSISKAKLYYHLLYLQVMVYLPVLLYASVIAMIAFKRQQYVAAIEVILFNLIMVAATAFVYVMAIRREPLFKTGFGLPSFNTTVPKPFFLIPLYFVWHDRKQMLFITKLSSLLLLYGFITLYEPRRYDIRPLLLCMLLVAAAHSAIVYQVKTFEEEYLSFSKNLPIKTGWRFVQLASMFSCLLMPELVLLFKGFDVHFTISDFPQLALMAVGLLCMFYVVLLVEETNMDQLIRIVFGILAACFFIILYNPGLLLPVGILMVAFGLYNAYYYRHEKRFDVKQDASN